MNDLASEQAVRWRRVPLGEGVKGRGAQDELTENTHEEQMELEVDCLLCSRQPGSQSSPGRQKAGALRVFSGQGKQTMSSLGDCQAQLKMLY